MNFRIASFLGLSCIAVAAAACSSSNNNVGNPLAGVTINQYTPSPTPVATPTPTPAPMATQAIADGSFASGAFGNGWTACSIPHVAPSSSASAAPSVPAGSIGAVIVSPTSSPFQVSTAPSPMNTPAVYAGDTYSAFTFSGTGASTTYGGLGTAGLNAVCQTVTLPADAVLTMEVNEGGSDSGLKYADQEADIIDPSGAETNLFYEIIDPQYNYQPGGSWTAKGPYALTSAPYNFTPGEKVTLVLGSYDSSPASQYGVYMFIDNVSITGTATASALRRRTSMEGPGPRR